MKKPLIVLTGPTAVGKTDLSIRLAEEIGGEIISADSMQIYKKMNIGTAKIMPEEMRGIPHYLVDCLDPGEEFNVTVFKEMALEAVDRICANGHIPIVVGGTGFYIQALLYDVDFSVHEEEETYRKYLRTLEEEKGKDYLYHMLVECDPEYASQVHSNNVKRVIRALEYYHETGNRLSDHNRVMRKRISPYNFAYFVLYHDRQILYDRINQRVDRMMEAGLLEEVEGLIREGYGKDLVSMQGIGYKEFFDYFEGKETLEETIDKIKKDTRHFAKRQMTWFRREKEVIWMDKGDYGEADQILSVMKDILKTKEIITEMETNEIANE